MNPFQKNKVDISALSPEEQKVFRMYGKLPDKKDLFQNKLKERKYFDSGDYAMSKAGKAGEGGVASVGSEHPQPENIPHLTSHGPNGAPSGAPPHSSGAGTPALASGSLVKESSFLQRETSLDGTSSEAPRSPKSPVSDGPEKPTSRETVPARWQQ